MSGTKAGGLKAAQTNKEKYGPEFYEVIGRAGGKNGHTGGFYDRRPKWEKLIHPKNPLAQEAGRKGGAVSRRGKATYEK